MQHVERPAPTTKSVRKPLLVALACVAYTAGVTYLVCQAVSKNPKALSLPWMTGPF